MLLIGEIIRSDQRALSVGEGKAAFSDMRRGHCIRAAGVVYPVAAKGAIPIIPEGYLDWNLRFSQEIRENAPNYSQKGENRYFHQVVVFSGRMLV